MPFNCEDMYFFCEEKNNCSEIAEDKYWAKQLAKQEILNLSEHSIYSCAEKVKKKVKNKQTANYFLFANTYTL